MQRNRCIWLNAGDCVPFLAAGQRALSRRSLPIWAISSYRYQSWNTWHQFIGSLRRCRFTSLPFNIQTPMSSGCAPLRLQQYKVRRIIAGKWLLRWYSRFLWHKAGRLFRHFGPSIWTDHCLYRILPLTFLFGWGKLSSYISMKQPIHLEELRADLASHPSLLGWKVVWH